MLDWEPALYARNRIYFREISFLHLAQKPVQDSGEDAKGKGARKGGLDGKKKKGRGDRAFNHFFYNSLPPPFEIIRFRLPNC